VEKHDRSDAHGKRRRAGSRVPIADGLLRQIAGEAHDFVRIVDGYARWLSSSPIPKLFINAEPAGFLIGEQPDFCRRWPNQEVVTVQGPHFLPEDAPEDVGKATARFIAKVLARQVGPRM
jgi:haloalkane dehalogenase